MTQPKTRAHPPRLKQKSPHKLRGFLPFTFGQMLHLSQERVKYVKYYVPMWIAPLCVLGGLGLLFFSVGDAEMRFLPASSAIILLYPLLTFLFNARLQRAKKSKARDLERPFDA